MFWHCGLGWPLYLFVSRVSEPSHSPDRIVHNLPSPAPLFLPCTHFAASPPSPTLQTAPDISGECHRLLFPCAITHERQSCARLRPLPLAPSSPSRRLAGSPPDRLALGCGHRWVPRLRHTSFAPSSSPSRSHQTLTAPKEPDRNSRRPNTRSRPTSPPPHTQGLTTKLALTARAVDGDAHLSPYRSSILPKGRHICIEAWASLGGDIVVCSAGCSVE